MPEPSRRRVEELFDQALDLDPALLAAFLDEQCAGDAEMRAAVEELLHLDRGAHAAESLLRSPLARSRAKEFAPRGAWFPAIDRYHVVRVLGEGGMGTVYEAEQDNPRRTVALKVIRAGLASDFLLKRFAREAQILGRLHHAGIAQVYDAGVSDNGEPYFAMELINGTPLDQYARDRSIDVPARLGLVARVCDAVQHAHERGVIHRDLKPGNILVEPSGQPRVLDFGVARAVDAGLTAGGGGQTEAGQLIGTLRYMSPEQASGDPSAIDQRCDVYALGVILYELLASRPPYGLDGLPLPEAVRAIREHEPSRLGSLDGRLRGDVETIAAKAMEKDKARRYATAADLAADVRRHLNNEPIRARPTSALYQLRKFARRNTALVAGVAGVFAALLAGTIVSVAFAWRADQSARVASAKERDATYEVYRARLSAALASHDVADAALQLELAPEGLHGWEWHHLHSRLDDSVAVIPAPPSTRLCPGPQGLRVVTLTDQGLRVSDADGRAEREVRFSHEKPLVWAVAQAPEGLLLLECAGDSTAWLRDATGAVRLRVRLPGDPVLFSVWHGPNVNRLAVVCRGPGGFSASVYDSTGKEQSRLPGLHRSDVWSVAFSPDGTRLATASDDHTARLWDAATGQPLGEPIRHPGKAGLFSATFSPDGTRVVTAARDGVVCQWDGHTGAAVGHPYEGHAGEVRTAVYSPDGEWVASAGMDRTIRVWRATGRRDALVLRGHTGTVTQLAFTEDGRRLGSLSEDGTARVWEADPQASLPALRGHSKAVYPVAYSPDGRWLASGGWDGEVRLWDARTGDACAALRHPYVVRVRALAFSPDGSWLVAGGDEDGRLRLWDVATGKLRKELPGPGGPILAVAVSPDGAQIAAVGWNGILSVRDVTTGRQVASVKLGGEGQQKGLAYSPDGRWLASTTPDFQVALWDVKTYRPSARWSGHSGEIFSVAFSPDGRRLASAGKDRIVRVWDVESGKCQAVLRGHTDDVFTVAFHPGGTRLATAGRLGTVWLWDLERTEDVARLAGHTSFIWSLAFTPDGKTLASGSGDITVRLWDTEPLSERYRARREAESLRPEAERLVERLSRQNGDPAAVVAALRADRALREPLRQAALRTVLRRTRPQGPAAAKPPALPSRRG
jgi:WD40 repeat protein/predicted Ser/Thr protein kinase